MIKSRKLSIFIFGLLLALASLIFVACDKLDYSKTYLFSSNGEYIELVKGEEKLIEITIKNPVKSMNKGLQFTSSNPLVASVTQVANQNSTTTYSVKGLSGGNTNVEFVSVEGRKTLTINIRVREYSDILTEGDNSLYISKSSGLTPKQSDFIFKDSATERNLEYYFYGQKKSSDPLTIEDITSNENYINNFVDAEIYSVENKDYLIFTDLNGEKYTLGEKTLVVGSNNEKYAFLKVEQGETGLIFDHELASFILPGMKFTFVAKYVQETFEEGEEPTIILCERQFSILSDIKEEDFSHEYGYKINEIKFSAGSEGTSYKIDSLKNGKVTLLPNYQTMIKDNPFLIGNTANFITAYLEVYVKTNDGLLFEAKTRDVAVANSKIIDKKILGENTVYYIEVNCGSGSANATYFDMSFYYQGFENSEDSNVNFTYSVPIEIRIIPVSLLINNVDFAQIDKVYRFYNSYASVDSGWQVFNFTVIPEGAEFDRLVLDLTDSSLQIKYQNVIYTSGLVEINNLREPVYVKGGDNAVVTSQVKNLPVAMDFNVIQEDSLQTNIKYEIVRGAKFLRYKTEEFQSKIYLERYSEEVLFNDIYADSEFSALSFTLESGNDVVRFDYDPEEIFDMQGLNYYLNLKLLPKAIGSGTYIVTLDNGVQISVTIEVREGLENLSLVTTNEDNSIKFKEDQENHTLIYLLNKNGNSYFDAKIVANDNVNSKAIISCDIERPPEQITLNTLEDGRILIYSPKSGHDEIVFKVQGYEIENFRRNLVTVDYILELITYELSEDLYVYKQKDAYNSQYQEGVNANYVYVYSNTINTDLREAKLDVTIKNKAAFLFQNPSNGLYLPSQFDRSFIYFESDAVISRNGINVDKMYYSQSQSNIFAVGSFGTFDTERLVFTAYSNVANSGRVRLVAHVMQFGKLFSFTININILTYNQVERISLQQTATELNFSVLNKEKSLIAYPTNLDATNGKIVALFSGGQINVSGKNYSMFTQDDIRYVESDGKTQIIFKINEDFLQMAEGYTDAMIGEFLIVASDWLDGSGNLRGGYNEYAISIKVNFANGTEKNRFILEDVDDLLAIKNNLSAHYKIKTNIDASSIVSELPLGELRGSIIGENEFAEISGLIITSPFEKTAPEDGIYHYGLFSSIAKDAYIEYVTFSGHFDLTADNQAFIGLIAGENRGKLINISAKIGQSSVVFSSTSGNSKFGGVVGHNHGEIIQDFTLFEDDNSITRTENVKALSEKGRLSYSGRTPLITTFMNDFVNVSYVEDNFSKYIGGVAGVNTGIIKKVDSQKLSFSGHTNYMAYALIRSNITATSALTNSNVYLGGLVGQNEVVNDGGQIIAGYNKLLNSGLSSEFSLYDALIQEIENEKVGNFEAGKGILVGGEVIGYGYVGGVAGRVTGLSSKTQFTGITTRTFVRAISENVSANLSLIAFIESSSTSNNLLFEAFAVQAIDDGRSSQESAMAILYGNTPSGLISDGEVDINRLGFGNRNHGISVLNSIENDSGTNVFSYVKRNYLDINEDNNAYMPSASKGNFYGDFLIIGQENTRNKISFQAKFARSDAKNLSISANFNNKLTSLTGNKDIFFGYYFEVASTVDSDISSVQNSLDLNLNKLNSQNSLYPIKINGEMTLSSKSTDILTFDQMGKITIKQTGLALITASSVLNSNDSLSFYIYVVNYFDSQVQLDENERSSIVYTTTSPSSVPVDKAKIELRGNNSATLYVLPEYSFTDKNIGFKSDKRGEAFFNNVYFYLSANSEVTADVEVIDKVDEEGNIIHYNESPIDINVVGQSITFRRLDDSIEDDYKLKIVPSLKVTIGEDEYFASVNKTLYDTSIEYKYGALEIRNKNYDVVPLQTSKTVQDTILIISTDENEKKPLYYIVGLDDKPLQGDLLGLEYSLLNEKLFDVSIEPSGMPKSFGNGTFEHEFTLEIAVNRNSSAFIDRYDNNIYGRYLIYIQSASNSSKSITFYIDFEQTGVTNIVIDNYTLLKEINDNKTLSSPSEYAYPGESGLMSLTINPEDSDFDYILIENDDTNYQSGKALATFGLLTRYQNNKVDNYNKVFEEGSIAGSTVAKGFKLSLSELVNVYGKGEDFVSYNGVIYLKYDISSSGVQDLSKSKINISIYKDGKVVYTSSKELTIKLQNYVAVSLEGKEEVASQAGYYKTYEVARGLKYKLSIDSYGFRQDNISIISDSSIGKITNENGDYYLTITESSIDYTSGNNEFNIITSASQSDGEVLRSAESKTKIKVFEYVVNYNDDISKNSDIVRGMGDGVINVQVGTKVTFSLDLYDFIEFNSSITGVSNKVDEFLKGLERLGTWDTITNLITDDQPDYRMAGTSSEPRKTYRLGYINDSEQVWSNYYFNSTGLGLVAKRTHIPEERFYYFNYTGYFNAENGAYVAKESGENQFYRKISTSFMLNVYSTSSEESPIPIYNYADLTKMQEGGYYILLNDITLPSISDEDKEITAFKPLQGNFASFDGNGHAINFAGTYDMENLSSIGLFSSLETNSIVKNLIINFTSSEEGSDLNTDQNDSIYGLSGLRTVKFITSADSFVFGGVVAENSGIITNCQVFTTKNEDEEYYLTVKADNALRGNSYVAGIAGYNNGYITNCGVSMNAKVPFNLAGVVAQNNRKIAGCYFKEGKLINNSQYDQHVAGFAISNSQDAQIITSFVSGEQSSTSLFSRDKNSFIESSVAGGGFILNNGGTISDCYTDIDLSRTHSEMAGFAYRNGGKIRNCFSLSILVSNTTASAGFARENTLDGQNGSFESCYYFYNLKNGSVDEGHYPPISGMENINVSLYNVEFSGIEKLTQGQFANVDKYFNDYSYDKEMSHKAVWFFSSGYQTEEFVEYIPTTEKITIKTDNDSTNNDGDNSQNANSGNSQTNTVYEQRLMQFGLNRLALVSPNIRVLSVRNFAYSEINETNGNVTYFYLDDEHSPDRGSIHNPRLITSAQSMEDEILNQTSSNNVNLTNYRIISDISYGEFKGHSKLFKVTFAANMEGNGMEISSVSLVYMNNRSNGGLFAQIGRSASQPGFVKNLTISPKEVVFNNTNHVGTLAGTLRYGYIYDIHVDATKYDLASVSGLNFVGGIIGKTEGDFEAKDIYSNANVLAVYSPIEENNSYVEGNGQSSKYSYAGGLIGFVGRGKVYNAHVAEIKNVAGSRAGFAYGGIGAGANVQYTFVDVEHGSKLRANHYAGFVVGEHAGTLQYAYVSDNNMVESTFVSIPKAAIGVGGIAGRFKGGLISNCLNSQSFRVVDLENEQVIQNVGGLVGVVSANGGLISTLRASVVDADFTAVLNLGGAVGMVSSSLRIEEVAVKSSSLEIKGTRANPRLGGIVAYLRDENYAALDMKNSYCEADLTINSSTTGVASEAKVGGLVADDSLKVPKLSYCYSTSKIKADIYDARALGTSEDFMGATQNISRYEYSSKNTNCERVYYLGNTPTSTVDNGGTIQEEGKDKPNEKPVYSATKAFVTFNTKVKSVPIKLTVNNYGTSSVEYLQSQNSGDVTDFTEKSLYNLYGNRYQFKDAPNLAVTGDKLVETMPGIGEYQDLSKWIGIDLYRDVAGQVISANINGIRIFRFNPNSSDAFGIYEEDKGVPDFNKPIVTFTLKNLCQNIIYRGSDGQYYRSSINNEGSEGYIELSTGRFVSGLQVSLVPVWSTSSQKLSTLSIELDFNWLDKK